MKDSTSPAVLGTYLERYPTGEFASIARALVEHYEQQLKLELAAREGERRRQEEEMKAAEARRLEDEQRAREAALAEERKRAKEAMSSQEALRQEKERSCRGTAQGARRGTHRPRSGKGRGGAAAGSGQGCPKRHQGGRGNHREKARGGRRSRQSCCPSEA